MVGKILKIEKQVGVAVEEDDVVIVMEAMKMENDVTAIKEGIVKKVNVKKNDNVNRGDTLIILE